VTDAAAGHGTVEYPARPPAWSVEWNDGAYPRPEDRGIAPV